MAGGSRQARKAARQRLGKLRDLTIAPKTRIRYDRAVGAFFKWCELAEVDQFEENAELIDLTEEFVEMAWEEGEPRATACDTLCGLQFYVPNLKGKLLGAWRLCKAWQKQELPTRAPPLLLGMTKAMAMLRGKKGQWRVATAYLVAYELCLRTGEILGLQCKDVVMNPTGDTAVLHLGMTKSGKRRGEPESVVLRNPVIVTMLAMALEGLQPGDRVVGITPAAFRTGFAEDIRRLGLDPTAYKPYSLRRGGATHRFRLGQTVAAISEIGRWAHLSTCKIYIEEALAELTSMLVPKTVRRRTEALEEELDTLLVGG